jgi:hypothetical protein
MEGQVEKDQRREKGRRGPARDRLAFRPTRPI